MLLDTIKLWHTISEYLTANQTFLSPHTYPAGTEQFLISLWVLGSVILEVRLVVILCSVLNSCQDISDEERSK